MNWSRGFKRIWYLLLGIIWLLVLAVVSGPKGGPGVLGEAVGYLLAFSVVWLLFGAAILWAARGFRRGS